MEYPKLANCSPEFTMKALKKIGGFSIVAGTKHYKVRHDTTEKCVTIPRRGPLKRGLMWSLVKDYLMPLGYTEQMIFSHLWC